MAGYRESLIGIPNVSAIPDLSGANLFAEEGIRSQVSALKSREETLVGTLSTHNLGQTHSFDWDELVLLGGMTHQAVQSIENCRLFQETHRNLSVRPRTVPIRR